MILSTFFKGAENNTRNGRPALAPWIGGRGGQQGSGNPLQSLTSGLGGLTQNFPRFLSKRELHETEFKSKSDFFFS